MRISIRHDTSYRYGEPVRSAMQLLRLTPRSSETQFVRNWRVTIDADARLDRGEDAYGNITHMVFVDGPLTVLRILVEGEVEMSDASGFVHGSVERQPAALFLRETGLTHATPGIRGLAREALACEGGDLLAGLHRINGLLHSTLVFRVGATTAATTAGEALAAGHGVCQDFAHVFIAAARTIGVPARYVSGYYLRSDSVTQEAGHAWAEAFLPTLGWIAFDPAQGHCATDRHVRIAIGSDGNEAAPIRGARVGGKDEALSVALTVAPGRAASQGTSRQSQVQEQGQLRQRQQQ